MSQSTQITDEEKQTIYALYDAGMNTVQISREINRNNSSIGIILKKSGRFPRSRKKTSSEQQQEILSLYQQGMTTHTIAEKFSLTGNTVASVIRDLGEKVRSRGHVIKIDNPDFFHTIDSEEKAYFLGLIIADGSIIVDKKNRTTFALSLKSEDEHILHSLSRCLGLPKDRVSKDNRGCSGVRTSSSQIIEDLSQYGVVPQKTFISYIPEIPTHLISHLLRGIFDGDGSVFVQKARKTMRCSIYGTHQLCHQYRELVRHHASMDAKGKVFDKTDVNVSFISFSSRKDVKAFYHFLYDNATIYLHRKKLVFESNLHLL